VYNAGDRVCSGFHVPILREGQLDIISTSPAQTERLGWRLGQMLATGDIICLAGDLGAGKTVIARGIAEGWGATTPVTSPTYNLVHQHTRPTDDAALYHIDCYRLSGASDLASTGWSDIVDSAGLLVIEWPERIQAEIPPGHIWVDLTVIDESRRGLLLSGTDAHHRDLVERLRAAAYGQGA
jgi:tRNA threonylcarbamoyladenosine biosynthesis protein TsaE